MTLRPGFLAGCVNMQPRKITVNYSGLGFFGKGAMVPPPGAPPAGSKGNIITGAVSKKTGKFYVQDSRCSEIGTKMTKFDEPCTDPDCDPGERDIYEECDDDPDYKELPPPPAGGFRSCADWNAVGYPPADCNKRTCPSCFQKRGPGPQQQQQRPTPPPKPSKPAPPPKPPPPPCPCAQYGAQFDRKSTYGPCPPVPPKCGRPPQGQKCTVPGYGLQNPVCKCGTWRCPTTRDMLMRMRGRKAKAAAGFGEETKKKLMPIWIGIGILALLGVLSSGVGGR